MARSSGRLNCSTLVTTVSSTLPNPRISTFVPSAITPCSIVVRVLTGRVGLAGLDKSCPAWQNEVVGGPAPSRPGACLSRRSDSEPPLRSRSPGPWSSDDPGGSHDHAARSPRRRPDPPRGADRLSPVLAPEGGVDYLLSDEAIAAGSVTVEEVSEGGSVPDLLVTNPGDSRVLFLEGEELRGAKQNRVLNTSVLVAAHSKTTIPVSCVEQGRWRYRTQALLPRAGPTRPRSCGTSSRSRSSGRSRPARGTAPTRGRSGGRSAARWTPWAPRPRRRRCPTPTSATRTAWTSSGSG